MKTKNLSVNIYKLYFYLIVFLTLFSFSCKGQDQDTIMLHVTNRTSIMIDSVIIPYKEIKAVSIRPGEKYTLIVDVSDFNNQHEGVIPFYIFQNQKKISGSFGFHDYGMFFKKEEYIYVYDKGFNYKDEDLKKPDLIKIFLVRKISYAIDSIEISPLILKKKTFQSTFIELLLDYALFEKNPEIKFYQKGKPYMIKVEHDWDNWNYNQVILEIYDNGVVSTK